MGVKKKEPKEKELVVRKDKYGNWYATDAVVIPASGDVICKDREEQKSILRQKRDEAAVAKGIDPGRRYDVTTAYFPNIREEPVATEHNETFAEALVHCSGAAVSTIISRIRELTVFGLAQDYLDFKGASAGCNEAEFLDLWERLPKDPKKAALRCIALLRKELDACEAAVNKGQMRTGEPEPDDSKSMYYKGRKVTPLIPPKGQGHTG